MSLTLDSICPRCSAPIRDHCRDVEGSHWFTPCVPLLLSVSPEDWREQVVNGICQTCRFPVADHWSIWMPSAVVRLGRSATRIFGVGEIVWRLPGDFTDCREHQPPSTAHEDGSPLGLRNPFNVPPAGS